MRATAAMLLALLTLGAGLAAQPGKTAQPADTPGLSGPTAEHRLLAEMAGEFNAAIRISSGKDESGAPRPDAEYKSAVVRQLLLGARFLREQLDVQAPTPFSLEMTLGYNPDNKPDQRFELTRLSSAAFPMMIERGAFDPSTKVFTFTGDHLIDGKRARTRSVLRLEAYTDHVLEVYVSFEDPADPKKVLTPEFRAYTVEYSRTK